MQISGTGFYPNNHQNKINSIKEIKGNLYCVGANQLILKILNDGKWEYISGKIGGIEYYDLVSSNDKIILAGDSNKIFTFDNNWQKQTTQSIQCSGKISKLEILNNNLVCLTYSGEVWYSTDYSLTWQKLFLDFPVNNINIFDEKFYFPSTEGRIFEYSIQLKFEKSYTVDTNVVLNVVQIKDEKMFAAGISNYFYRSDDGGLSFKNVKIGSNINDVNSFEYINDTTLLAGCSKGLIVYSDPVTKWSYLIEDYTRTSLINIGEQLYSLGHDINKIQRNQLKSNEPFLVLFKSDTPQYVEFSADNSKSITEFIALSQNRCLYRYSISNSVIDRIYENKTYIKSTIVEDNIILLTDKYNANMTELRSTITILNKSDFSVLKTVSADSGLSFEKIVKYKNDYYLCRWGSYFFKYNLDGNKLVKVDLPDSLNITDMKVINNQLVLRVYSISKNVYLLNYKNETVFDLVHLPFDDVLHDYYLDESNNFYFLCSNDKNCSASLKNSFLKKYDQKVGKLITLDSMLVNIYSYNKIVPISDGEYFIIGLNCLNYTNDNFKTFIRYSVPEHTTFFVLDIKKIANKYYALIDGKLYLLEIGESSIKLADTNDLAISPNPAGDFIIITLKPSEGFEPSEGSEINIFNTIGERVLSVGTGRDLSVRINISDLPKGVYFVKVGGETAKFVKM